MTIMRCSVDGKAFIQALDKLGGLIRSLKPSILSGVLVRFESDSCTLMTTDSERWLSVRLPAQGDGFTFFLSHPKQTARVFRQLDGELTLEQIETDKAAGMSRLALSCGPRSAEFAVFTPSGFPEPPDVKAQHAFTTNAARLYARVKRVKYAAAPLRSQGSRTCRNNIQFSGNRVYTVDGYRLACDMDTGLYMPAPFMALPGTLESLKLFGDQDVAVRLDEKGALITDGVTTLTFRLADGKPFDLDCAIPERFRTEFYATPGEFLRELDYLKRALPGYGPFLARFSDGKLYAESYGERYATKVEVAGCESVTFGFNLDYMADALEQFKGEPAVKLKLSGPMGPIIIEAEGRNDYAMVLPVRIKENSAAA